MSSSNIEEEEESRGEARRREAEDVKRKKRAVDNLVEGTYTMVLADMQRVSLVVKSSSNNTVVNATVPTTKEPYAAG